MWFGHETTGGYLQPHGYNTSQGTAAGGFGTSLGWENVATNLKERVNVSTSI